MRKNLPQKGLQTSFEAQRKTCINTRHLLKQQVKGEQKGERFADTANVLRPWTRRDTDVFISSIPIPNMKTYH